MFRLWTKNWRRRRLFRQGAPGHWDGLLRSHLAVYSRLSDAQRHRLLGLCSIFLNEKHFDGVRGFEINETAKLLIASGACCLLLGFTDYYCFDRVNSIVVYPQPMRMSVSLRPGEQSEPWLSGLYSSDVAIVLSWSDVQHDLSHHHSKRNLVIHEFAHHIDELDGFVDGDPPFPSRRMTEQWRQIARDEFRHLRHAVETGQPTILDDYGAVSQVEFFAVACEAFFCEPIAMFNYHPRLFELLVALFKLDPRQWYSSDSDSGSSFSGF